MKKNEKGKQERRFVKKTAVIFAAAAIAVFSAVLDVIPVLAESGKKSSGNFAVEEGNSIVNSTDIGTLQEELNMLYKEVPDMPQISDGKMTRRNRLKSKGRIDYENGKVVICADDFVYLADEIDILEIIYKAIIVKGLNGIGTYFTKDGLVVHEQEDNCPDDLALKLSLARLYDGILNSQSVEHLINQQIYAAVSDNLSAGTAAWVNGELIIGNGADNNAYYEEGFAQGLEEGKHDMTLVTKAISIMYNHRAESERTGLISDANGFFAVASGTDDYAVNPAMGHSGEITLIDLSEDDTRLLYEITISGSVSAEELQYGAGYDAGVCIYLKDANGNLIDSKSTPYLNEYNASYTISFKLFDYNIDTSQVYVEYLIRPYVYSQNCTDPNSGHEYHAHAVTAQVSLNDYIDCTYYCPE